MKLKKLLYILIFLLFCGSLSFGVSAVESDYFNQQFEASGADKLWDTLTAEDEELLEKLGIEKQNFDSIFDVSFRNIADFFYELIRGEYTSVINTLAVLLAVVVIVAAVNQFVPEGSETARILDFISCVTAAVLLFNSISSCITNAVSAFSCSSNFIVALVPVLAAVISVSGLPTLALTYNSLSFAAAQFVSYAAESFVVPLIRVVFSLSVISSVSNALNISRFVDFFKKVTAFIFTFSSTVFITMLSMKGMLAASADNVAVRGVRFLIGNIVPVVGGAVSDAYLSIVGTLNLVKSTVGVFAVAAVAVINLPVIIQCVLWIFSLNLLSVFSDVFSQNQLSRMFTSASSALTLLAVSVFFEMLVFLLSLGLVLVIKGGG